MSALITIDASALVTKDKKDRVVSFTRSIAFASKDARMGLAVKLYQSQVAGGNFGTLIRDALDAGVVSKRDVGTIIAILGPGRNPSKANAATAVRVILAAIGEKELKGQKALYGRLIRDLARVIVEAEAEQPDTVEA
jgi:hypothetical protein